jgi:hypothetical protein
MRALSLSTHTHTHTDTLMCQKSCTCAALCTCEACVPEIASPAVSRGCRAASPRGPAARAAGTPCLGGVVVMDLQLHVTQPLLLMLPLRWIARGQTPPQRRAPSSWRGSMGCPLLVALCCPLVSVAAAAAVPWVMWCLMVLLALLRLLWMLRHWRVLPPHWRTHWRLPRWCAH